MRVLYLWNPAGALVPVADWLLDNGHTARIIMSKEFDLFGNTSISPAAIMVNSSKEYWFEVIHQLLCYHPTHIHVNASLPSLVLARLLRPSTPIVFQYHGIEVRYRKSVHEEMALADKVIVSTPDLSEYGEWFDRPVAKMFHYRGGRKHGTALMFYADFFMKDLRNEAKKWCDERGFDLTIIERGKHEGIPYLLMPTFLSQFEYFLDFKGYGDPKAISRLAIEAYACGCKIVSDTNPSRVITDYELPKPEIYINLYKSLSRPPVSFRRMNIAYHGFLRWASGTLTKLPEISKELE
ncbi:MAG: hypothetical protein ACFFCX_16350 [Candidatus Sifarchaeia archaeon]